MLAFAVVQLFTAKPHQAALCCSMTPAQTSCTRTALKGLQMHSQSFIAVALPSRYHHLIPSVPFKAQPCHLMRQSLLDTCNFLSTGAGTDVGKSTAAVPPPAMGYLAQHPLFEQIPELAKDITEPEYCSLGSGSLQSVNAWFGPARTVCLQHTSHF